MMKTALVTGSDGFVGRHFVKELLAREYDVVGMDIVSGHDVRVPPPDGDYDLVVHCAYNVGGRAGIDGHRGNLAANLTIDGTMFSWAFRNRPAAFLYFSSSAAYPVRYQGKETNCRLREDMIDVDDPDTPDADYGWGKLTGERMARNYAALGHRIHVVRPFSGYGADQSLDYPFPTFVYRAQQLLDPFPVWGDPTSARDWIHVTDVVKGALAIVDADVRTPVNVCSGVPTTMETLAKLCMREAGYSGKVESMKGPEGVHTRVGDPKEFRKYYSPAVSLAQGVKWAVRGEQAS